MCLPVRGHPHSYGLLEHGIGRLWGQGQLVPQLQSALSGDFAARAVFLPHGEQTGRVRESNEEKGADGSR